MLNNIYFLKSAVYEIMWKNILLPGSMAHAHCLLDN